MHGYFKLSYVCCDAAVIQEYMHGHCISWVVKYDIDHKPHSGIAFIHPILNFIMCMSYIVMKIF